MSLLSIKASICFHQLLALLPTLIYNQYVLVELTQLRLITSANVRRTSKLSKENVSVDNNLSFNMKVGYVSVQLILLKYLLLVSAIKILLRVTNFAFVLNNFNSIIIYVDAETTPQKFKENVYVIRTLFNKI